jgi:hypothetical protein
MVPRSQASIVEAWGFNSSTPGSLTKEEVTMKKISIMKTTSSIGVKSI